jgi:hypothetical protein
MLLRRPLNVGCGQMCEDLTHRRAPKCVIGDPLQDRLMRGNAGVALAATK